MLDRSRLTVLISPPATSRIRQGGSGTCFDKFYSLSEVYNRNSQKELARPCENAGRKGTSGTNYPRQANRVGISCLSCSTPIIRFEQESPRVSPPVGPLLPAGSWNSPGFPNSAWFLQAHDNRRRMTTKIHAGLMFTVSFQEVLAGGKQGKDHWGPEILPGVRGNRSSGSIETSDS